MWLRTSSKPEWKPREVVDVSPDSFWPIVKRWLDWARLPDSPSADQNVERDTLLVQHHHLSPDSSTLTAAQLTCVQGAAEGQAAVLGVKWEGVHFQAAGSHHLHGLIVLDHASCIQVSKWKVRGSAGIHPIPGSSAGWRKKKKKKRLKTVEVLLGNLFSLPELKTFVPE